MPQVAYFYAIYFLILLIHRAVRDDHFCREKYGPDWLEYKKKVPAVFVPGIICRVAAHPPTDRRCQASVATQPPVALGAGHAVQYSTRAQRPVHSAQGRRAGQARVAHHRTGSTLARRLSSRRLERRRSGMNRRADRACGRG